MNKEFDLKFKEKMSYGFGVSAGNLPGIFFGAFVSYYYTDVVGISAAAIALIISISTISDGLSDLVAGTIMDRIHSKRGKAHPFLLFGQLGAAVFMWLMFNVPGVDNMNLRLAYIFITYFIIKAVFMTAGTLGANTMISLITRYEHERNELGIFNLVFNVIFSAISIATTLPLLELLGGIDNQNSWTIITSVYTILLMIMTLIAYFGMTERNITIQSDTNDKKASKLNKPSITVMIKAVFTNKYFLLLSLMIICFFVQSTVTSMVGVYYFVHVFPNTTVFSIMTGASTLAVFIALPFTLFLCNRFGTVKVMTIGAIGCGLVQILRFINPYSSVLLIGTALVAVFLITPFSAFYASLGAKVVDYGEWKTGIRTDGLIFSSTGVGAKIAGGIGSAVTGWILSINGYSGLLEVQPASAVSAIKWLFLLTPILAYLIMALSLKLFDMDKYMPQVKADLEKRRALDLVDFDGEAS